MDNMRENLLAQLKLCTNLPSLPAVALKIIDLASKSDTNLTEINHYISLDPALAIKIVRIANSPLYKSRRTLSNVSQAVSVLGMHGVMTIALSFTLTDSLMKYSKEGLNSTSSNIFWRRSITAALASRALGKKIKMNNQLDNLFLAGLLQDIGILALYAILPEDYPQIFTAAASHDALYHIEKKTFGIGHDQLGSALLERWKLPDYITHACKSSHNASDTARPGINECVAASGYITDYFLAPDEKEKINQAINAVRTYLGLDELALMEVLEDMKNELHDVEELFEISIARPTHLSGIIEQARELLTMQTLTKVRELEDRAQHDSLTGVHNRSCFDETLQREFLLSVEQKQPFSVAMIDIDHFKNVNDTYGHMAGDEVLVAVAKAISSKIRQTDDILCRYGGEEFAVILPGATLTAACIILTRVKESISAIDYKLDTGASIHITVSIGLAVNMDKEQTFDTHSHMLEAADCALYAAKHAGRNQITEWNPSLVSHTR
jgi:diguanylate cyclase (GGDEF)-like protein